MKLRLGSFLFLLFVTSLVLLTPAIIWGTLLGHKEGLIYSAILLVVAVIAGLLQLLIGAGVRCPLCHGTVIGRNGSSRSRKGSKTLGSYRLGVALRVLTVGHYRCPYCGEPTKCQSH